MKTAEIPMRCLLFLLPALVPLSIRADGIFDYTDGETNPSAIVLTEDYNDFNMPSGSAVQSGAVSTASTGLSVNKYGAGTLTFSGTLDVDGYFYPQAGVTISSAPGSFIDYLAVDNYDAGLPAVVFGVSAGTLEVSSLYVATYGSGTLRVTGGTLDNSASSAAFGYNSGAIGSLMVSGASSELRSESIDLGLDGAGIATVSDGGMIAATAFDRRITLGQNTGGRGALNIGAASGDAAGAAGIVDAARITGGDGGGKLVFNHSGVLHFTRNGLAGGQTILIEGNVELLAESGITALSGANTFTGGATITTGTLVISEAGGNNSVLGTGDVFVAENGTLAGHGLVLGDATIAGTLAPGSSPGLMTFNGDLALGSTAAIEIELGGSALSEYDRIAVDGSLVFGGALNISFLNGFIPEVGDAFQLFEFAAPPAGTFEIINFSALGYAADFDYATGVLTFAAVPEPGALAPLGATALLALAFLRRHNPWRTSHDHLPAI